LYRYVAAATMASHDDPEAAAAAAARALQQTSSAAGRRTLTPPDPQLKGARYPGGFKPLPLNINPGFKTCRFKL
jgi:hypothetical protein